MEQPEEVPAGEDEERGPDTVSDSAPPEFTPTHPDNLPGQVHMEAGDMEAGRIEAVGRSFGEGRANALSFADFLRRTTNAVFEIAQDFAKKGEMVGSLDILQPEFASAKVTFVLGPFETVRLDVDQTSPSRDAAGALTDLLGATSEGILDQVQQFRPDTIYALKRLLTFVKDEDLEVAWIAYKRDPVQINAPRAATNLAALDRIGEIDSKRIVVGGHLEMTDAASRSFRLRLYPGQERPEGLERKRTVQGKYSELVGLHVREMNLWDKDVIATVVVETEREGTSATPGQPKFDLVQVEEAPPSVQTPELLRGPQLPINVGEDDDQDDEGQDEETRQIER